MPAKEEKEKIVEGGMGRVKQFFRGVQQQFSGIKVQSGKVMTCTHIEDPAEVQELSRAFVLSMTLLQRLSSAGPELSAKASEASELRKTFGSAVDLLGKTRSEQVVAATRGITAGLSQIDDAWDKCDACLSKFSKSMSALEAGKVAVAREQLGLLDAARAELDSELGRKEETADPEKVEAKRKRLASKQQVCAPVPSSVHPCSEMGKDASS